MNLQELKNFVYGACDILKMGVNDGEFNEFANLLYIKYQYSNKLDELLKLDDSLILDYYQRYFEHDPLIEKSKIRDIKILRAIINHFNDCDIKKDCLCDAFEYFFSHTIISKKSLGEFYTPRHIVQTIVRLVHPKAGESIYDPFAGCGGILVKCHKHNPNLSLHGGEITNNARIANMNMILNGAGHSSVKQIDSLENPIDGEYDCVITNIPFSQKVSLNASEYYYNGLAKKSGDGVCILHCFKSIKKGGRMALIVPEGVLFKKTLSSLRRFLLENAKLELVISLPQGVFLPYAGVKTSILYFSHCHETDISRAPYIFL